jgi:hypothetical protein
MTEHDAREFVLSRCPLPSRTEKPRRVVPEGILALEGRLAGMLPPELMEWLPRAGSAAPDDAGSVESFNTFEMMMDFFRTSLLERISPPAIVEGVRKWMEDWLERRWLPIAGDGCGDYILLVEHSPGRRIVVFWDQSNGYDEYDYVYASNLWHFLAGALKEPHEDWPFKREATLAFDPGMGELKGVRFGWDSRAS